MRDLVWLFLIVVGLGVGLTLEPVARAHERNNSKPFARASQDAPEALLLEENFSYSTGQLTTVSGASWVNFSGTGNFIQVSNGSLTYTGYGSSGVGNKIDIISVGTSAEDAHRQFTTQASGTVYGSFLVNVANTTGLAANSSTTGDYFAGFLPSSSTTALNARVSIRLGSVADTYQLGLRATSANAATAFSNVDLNPGTTYLVILSYQLVAGNGNDPINMWINPALGGSEPAPTLTQTTATAADNADIARFFVRQGTTTTPNASIDGIRVGTTWSDVAGSGAATTPPKLFETYLNGANEVPPNASTARGYGRVFLNDAETQITASLYWDGLGSNTSDAHIHGPAAAGANAGVIFGMTPPGGSTGGSAENRVFAVTAQQVADLKAGLWYFNIHSVNIPGGEIRGQLAVARQPVDFNADGMSDFSVVRNVSNVLTTYNLLNGTGTVTGVGWGAITDRVVSGDVDGDKKADIIVWRSGTQGRFFIIQSSDATAKVIDFGQTSDDPTVLADYTGDGKDDLAVFRQGHWWYQRSEIGGNGCSLPNACNDVTLGQSGDIPVPADTDGDGKSDFVVSRFESGARRLWGLTAAGAATNTLFGSGTDLIAPVDHDGDGRTDFAFIREVAGVIEWHIRLSSTGQHLVFSWGASGDTAVPGDYDGDGRTDLAVWRAGTFYIRRSTDGALLALQWGVAGDFPTAAYNVHSSPGA